MPHNLDSGEQVSFADIDVLVVCRDGAEATRVRAETAGLCERWPLHLLVMTKAEANATNFVAAQGCRPFPALQV